MSDSTLQRGLQTHGLTVRYGGVVANADLDVAVAPGQVVGLIGPNGAGKTTFVDAVTGFARSTGEVLLDGRRVDGLPPHRRRAAGVSRTWQAGELFGNLTVAENILVAAHPGGWRTLATDLFRRRRREVETVVEKALAQVGLEGVTQTKARDLSLGQQKLVGVARALAGECGVLLLDEPAAGLDSNESMVFARRIRAIAESGPGILLIDHDMSLVLSVCDHVCVMEFGKMIFQGTPAQARVDPAVVGAYLGVPMETSHG